MTTAAPTLSQPSLLSRIYGFGSIFAKTVRDSRRATLIAAAVLAFAFLALGKAIVTQFNTPESRAEIDALVQSVPPILQGLAGKVVNVGTLGGYFQYKYGTFFPLVLSLWSILALSGTLAGEATRGSLEFVAATGRSRRRIALEKLSGHVLMVGVACLVGFASIAYAGATYPVLPGDEISVAQAFGYAAWLGLMVLAAGGLAFALGPFVGRGAAAGVAGFVTFAGFILNGYQQPVPELAPYANLTWWGWTSNHIPLGGQFDWPSVALVGIVTVVLLAIGVEAFARRDLGGGSSRFAVSMPRPLLGLSGPVARAISLGLPTAFWWGIGVGLFGLVFGGAAGPFMEQLGKAPDFVKLLETVFPGVDYASAGGFLQLLFVELGVIFAGLAAASLVGGWASDETSGRLEMVLATPLERVRWALSGAVGMLVNVAIFAALAAAGIAIGVSTAGADVATPVAGSLILGVYAVALVGIGMAVGGLFGTRLAAPVVVVFVLLTWFVQFTGGLLKLPDAVMQLALTSHYGQTFVGVWDWVGVAVSVGIAIVGIGLGAWGFRRRDLRA
ncbi:MAG TPA: ABC transporter permease subunit [Candidatus Limnocylindria bacterium]